MGGVNNYFISRNRKNGKAMRCVVRNFTAGREAAGGEKNGVKEGKWGKQRMMADATNRSLGGGLVGSGSEGKEGVETR